MLRAVKANGTGTPSKIPVERRSQVSSYVDILLTEWGVDGHAPRLAATVRDALSELAAEAYLLLRDPRLQVVIRPAAAFSVWAYFPVGPHRSIVKELASVGVPMRPTTRVLLLIDARMPDKDEGNFSDHLRDHLGHVLLYLRDPRAKNDCDAAMREWDAWSTGPNSQAKEK